LPNTETEWKPNLFRAERSAYQLLLKNDLDPFEFDVTIHGRVLDGKVAYVLEISTLDRAISVRETGIPPEFIESIRTTGGDAFARIVEHLVPRLIESMSSSGPIPETMCR
jgi:hypothetical protein